MNMSTYIKRMRSLLFFHGNETYLKRTEEYSNAEADEKKYVQSKQQIKPGKNSIYSAH